MGEASTTRKPEAKPESARVTQVTSEEARRELGELLNRAEYGGERIEIMRRGRVSAVLVSPDALVAPAA